MRMFCSDSLLIGRRPLHQVMQLRQSPSRELMLAMIEEVLLKERMALSCELKVPIPLLRRRQGRNRNFQWHGSET